jgi:hypothetical protein
MVAGPERLLIPNSSNKRSIGFTSTFTCFTSGNLWKGCHSSRIMELALGLMISSIAPIRLWSFECCLLMNCSNFFIIGLFIAWSLATHPSSCPSTRARCYTASSFNDLSVVEKVTDPFTAYISYSYLRTNGCQFHQLGFQHFSSATSWSKSSAFLRETAHASAIYYGQVRSAIFTPIAWSYLLIYD